MEVARVLVDSWKTLRGIYIHIVLFRNQEGSKGYSRAGILTLRGTRVGPWQ
jgi:hypothetical protein